MINVLRSIRFGSTAGMGLVLIGLLALTTTTDAVAAPKLPTKPRHTMPTAPKISKTKQQLLQLDPSVANKIKGIGSLSRNQKRQLFLKEGIKLASTEIKAPTALTPRKPFRDHTTFVSFVGTVAVLPGDNMAQISSGFAVPNFNPGAIFFGGGSSSAPTMPTSFAMIEFKAAANTHYVVDCRVHADGGGFASQVWASDEFLGEGSIYTNGHVAQLVAQAPQTRRVRVVFYNHERQWTVSRCDITPAG